jgi:hypothetical protein
VRLDWQEAHSASHARFGLTGIGGCVGSDTHFSMKNEKLGSGMEIARVDERAAPKNH